MLHDYDPVKRPVKYGHRAVAVAQTASSVYVQRNEFQIHATHRLRRPGFPCRLAVLNQGRFSHVHAQHRHHRPRRPRQNHARRQAAAAVRRLPREPARRRAGDGFQRPREGARHHHPGQGHLGGLEGYAHQHRRHPRPRRFRRRGRAHPQHGR
ncbi:hypothetical protein BOSE21B_50338 [Bosea sp. 21B]|nr:hypothetical protein BOSE21B_50338 [Bosea sp. 21B]